jgi:hypothetical protein
MEQTGVATAAEVNVDSLAARIRDEVVESGSQIEAVPPPRYPNDKDDEGYERYYRSVRTAKPVRPREALGQVIPPIDPGKGGVMRISHPGSLELRPRHVSGIGVAR